MKIYFSLIAFLFACIFYGCKDPKTKNEAMSDQITQEPLGKENVAYKWGEMALLAQANDTERYNPRPTVTSRYLGLVFTAVFDAWSRFDEKAIPVYLKDVPRAAASDQTLTNKEIAISHAAYHTLLEYYPADSLLYKQQMRDLGMDPEDTSRDNSTPVGIGNLAAVTIIEARKNDGANQYGEEEGSDGVPYFNYTGYEPVNSADENRDPNKWQPKYFSDGKGGQFAPGCLTPFWDKVTPLALESGDQFRPGPPPMVGSKQLEEEVKEVIELQANLTDAQKALVEFMRDGPKSVQQAGHWLKFAQDVSRRDNNDLDTDVKMYFLNQVVAMDAFIASWDSKMFYDFARPYALVHEYYDKQKIKAWGGPYKGFKEMDGSQWRPYSPDTFLCPPFPSYVSGHSTISGACGEALRLFTGRDTFGEKITLVAGALTEPEALGDTVTIEFPTFTETANMAGKSRVLGGYHIESDNSAGLELGRDVATYIYNDFYLKHIGK